MSVGTDDPGVAIDYGDNAAIHAALAVAGSPVPQGADPAASALAFRAWASATVFAVRATAGPQGAGVALIGGGLSDAHFHHFTGANLAAIMIAFNQPTLAWAYGCNGLGLSCGKMFFVTNEGVGSNQVNSSHVNSFLG